MPVAAYTSSGLLAPHPRHVNKVHLGIMVARAGYLPTFFLHSLSALLKLKTIQRRSEGEL